MKWTTPAFLDKNSRAKVVFPAPFGPPMMMQRHQTSVSVQNVQVLRYVQRLPPVQGSMFNRFKARVGVELARFDNSQNVKMNDIIERLDAHQPCFENSRTLNGASLFRCGYARLTHFYVTDILRFYETNNPSHY
jgi:hypothetical protein